MLHEDVACKSKNSSKNHNTTPFLPSKDSRLAMDYFIRSVDNGSGNLNVHTSFPTLWPKSALYGGNLGFPTPNLNHRTVCSLATFEMWQGKGRHVHNTSIAIFQNIRILRNEQTSRLEYRNRVCHARFVHIVHKLVWIMEVLSFCRVYLETSDCCTFLDQIDSGRHWWDSETILGVVQWSYRSTKGGRCHW